MLRRVCEKNNKFSVSTIEVDTEELLGTIETLKRIQKSHPEHEIWFTMGTDNLKNMALWKGYKKLVTHFKALMLERDDDDVMEHIINQNHELKAYKDSFIKVKETVRSNCNSTLIRDKIRRGKSIRYLVPDEVYEYISLKGMYTIVE